MPSGHAWWLYNAPAHMKLLWMSVKRRQTGIKRGQNNSSDFFMPLAVPSTTGVGACNNGKWGNNNGHCLFNCTFGIRIGNQKSEHRSLIFGRPNSYCPPGSCKLCISCSRNVCAAAYGRAEGWEGVPAIVLGVEIDPMSCNLLSKPSPWKLCFQ